MKITKSPNLLQILRLCDLILKDRVNYQNFESFLKNPEQIVPDVFPTAFDASAVRLSDIKRSIKNNNINVEITEERFGFTPREKELYDGLNINTVDFELISFLDGETAEEATDRLCKDYILENLGELTVFLNDNPEEVKKYDSVVALGNTKLIVNKKKYFIPFVGFLKVQDEFFLELVDWKEYKFRSDSRVLVSKKIKIE